jgi:tRNA-modifying protein YgfZ
MVDQRKAVGLPNRGVIKVSGDEARDFLDKLITASMDKVAPGQAIHCALLTPQGKIIADFFVTEADPSDGGGFYCDVPLIAASDLAKRFGLYKLRAKVLVEDMSPELGIVAVWERDLSESDLPESDLPERDLSEFESSLTYADPRSEALGLRIIAHKSQFAAVGVAFGVSTSPSSQADLEAYHQDRAMAGLGEAGFDFILGDAFPHEINMDQLGGVDFTKGCYIGQEVVSRMQHRGTARTRLVPLKTANGFCVAENIPVLAGDKTIGTTGTGGKGLNLGMIRLDKAADAIKAGMPITAGAVEVALSRPLWWKAVWPPEGGRL